MKLNRPARRRGPVGPAATAPENESSPEKKTGNFRASLSRSS